MIKFEAEPAEASLDAERLPGLSEHFRRYVDDGRLPGWAVAVCRHGRVAYVQTYGQRDLEADAPVEVDTVFRIYSMTKPITSLAAMTLYERAGSSSATRSRAIFPSSRICVSIAAVLISSRSLRLLRRRSVSGTC
jgi:hypothetical protein